MTVRKSHDHTADTDPERVGNIRALSSAFALRRSLELLLCHQYEPRVIPCLCVFVCECAPTEIVGHAALSGHCVCTYSPVKLYISLWLPLTGYNWIGGSLFISGQGCSGPGRPSFACCLRNYSCLCQEDAVERVLPSSASPASYDGAPFSTCFSYVSLPRSMSILAQFCFVQFRGETLQSMA